MGQPSRDAIFADVRARLADELSIDAASIERTTSLQDDVGIDSLTVIELMVEAEEAYGVVLTTQDLRDVTTVGELVDLIGARLAPR